MRKSVHYQFLLVILSIILFSCKKDNTIVNDNLPEATQIGANTFGCLVNGKVFVSKGYDGTGRPNPHVIYDIGLNGMPYLSIEAKQYVNNNVVGGLDIAFGNIDIPRTYSLPNDFSFSLGWDNVLGDCGATTLDASIQTWGGGTITKLDNLNRIVSGTFTFKVKKTACDTIYITDGRFDFKF